MKSKLIGNNIKRRRHELKMTQAQLAERAHISDVHISHIETAKAAMSIESLLAICEALNTTPNDILLGEYFYPTSEEIGTFRETGDNLDYEDKIFLQQIVQLLKERQQNKKIYPKYLK